MPSPVYNNIKGTTSGTPGTGAFTPNAASAGAEAWSTVPAGWMGMVRFEDGSAWSREYCYWNGTTLSRSATQDCLKPDGSKASSTGSHLSLTSAATAAMTVSSDEVMSHLGGVPWRGWIAQPGGNGLTALGAVAIATVGATPAAASITATNFLTEQPRHQITSATTANAQAGWHGATAVPYAVYSTASGRGGGEFVARFGYSQGVTGQRIWVAMTGTTLVSNTGEPSALVGSYAAFAKDSTDTNLQLLTNSGSGAGTKIDTGIAPAANAWFEASIWWEPGGGRIFGNLLRLDTGAIFIGSTNTDIPANGTLMMPQYLSGLSSTTGTAVINHLGSMIIRGGS